VEAARDLIGLALELAARMELREHDLCGGAPLRVPGMRPGGYAPAIVDDRA
jgi:hypothetical protein